MPVNVEKPDTNALGVILADRLAPRLGPLGLDKNESFLMVAQQPLLVHQLRTFLDAGIHHVVVFTRNEWARQLGELTSRGMAGMRLLRVDIVADQTPSAGPAVTISRVLEQYTSYRQIIVLDAGCFLPFGSLQGIMEGDWVGVAEASKARGSRSCAGRLHTDDNASSGKVNAIGAYGFSDSTVVRQISSANAQSAEFGMATIVNQYAAHRALKYVHFDGWRDLSSLDSIGFAVDHMRTRPHNIITRVSTTMLQKHSEHPDFRAEVEFFRKLDAKRAHFFPRCEVVDDTRYCLDYIDLPTLAQLYLYWPAQPTHWSGILQTITDALKEEFWPAQKSSNLDDLRMGGQDMYINKARLRLRQWADPMAGEEELKINDSRCVAGEKLMGYLTPKLKNLAYNPIPAFLHGDLNFANILYSLNGRTFQLLDPRGAWSDYGAVGDLRYDLAKLRYSYNGMFNAICDGLFTLKVSGSRVTFDLGPERPEEICTCDQVIGEFADIRDLHLIEATLLLSAPPLHGGPGENEPRALYIRGVQLANELLDGSATT